MNKRSLTEEESLSEIKRLMEFHFKSHNRDSVDHGDYPSFNQYIDEIISEEDPEGKPPIKKQVQPQKKVLPPPQQLPKIVNKEPNDSKLDTFKVLLDKQTSKTDELLGKLNDIELKLNSVNQINSKIDNLSKEIEEIKPPSYEDQLEMISKNSYPYNVKLSDYWGFDNKEPEPKEYTLNPDDIKNYSEMDIKNSFAPDLNKNTLNKVR